VGPALDGDGADGGGGGVRLGRRHRQLPRGAGGRKKGQRIGAVAWGADFPFWARRSSHPQLAWRGSSPSRARFRRDGYGWGIRATARTDDSIAPK
jgi:hypothetical protein